MLSTQDLSRFLLSITLYHLGNDFVVIDPLGTQTHGKNPHRRQGVMQ